MVATMRIADSCYYALKKMQAQVKKRKKQVGDQSRTTLGECVCKLLTDAGWMCYVEN